MAWGDRQNADQLLGVGDTEVFFNLTPTLNEFEYALCQVRAQSSGTTDDLNIKVYTTLSDPDDWDTVPISGFLVESSSGALEVISFFVRDVYKFRVGVSRKGSTDTFTVDLSYRIAPTP